MTIAFLRKPMQTFNRATSSFNAKKREVDAAWGGPPMAQRTPTLPALVLQLRGDQRAMGEQHGEALLAEGGYQATLDWYPGMAERIVTGKRDHVMQQGVPLVVGKLGAVLLDRMAAHRPAELRARTDAFLRVLDRNPLEARAVGVMDLLQNLIGVAGRFGAGGIGARWSSAVPGACSTLAVWDGASAGGGLRGARNFDFPGAGCWEAGPVIGFATPDAGLRYGFVTTRGADAPCVSVWNEAGIVITIHTRFHRDVRFDARIAVDLVHEMVRRAATIDEAVAIVREAPVASSWGIVVASAKERRAVLVEVHGRDVAVTEANAGEDFLACTNRYQSNAMQRGELEPSPGWIMHSDGRHQSLRRQARRGLARGGLSAEALCALLGSHEDPEIDGLERAAGGVLAQPNGVHSVVIDAERQVTLVSVGAVPTGHGPWIEVPWVWEAAPGVRQVDLRAVRDAHSDDDSTPGARYRSGALGEAYGHLLEACRLESSAGPAANVRASLDAACALAPQESSWQLLAAGMAMRSGALGVASDHFDSALAGEHAPFYRGRLLHWASRAADAEGRARRADALRSELLRIDHHAVSRYQAASKRDAKRPYTAARARRVPVAVQLCDLG